MEEEGNPSQREQQQQRAAVDSLPLLLVPFLLLEGLEIVEKTALEGSADRSCGRLMEKAAQQRGHEEERRRRKKKKARLD
jgi:hypothetical protein